MTSSPYVPCYETAANGIRGERTRLRRWPIKAQALCRETQPVARQALAAESTVEPRCGSGLAVPACLVGLVGVWLPGQGR
jgi:hypothetical protein